MSGAIKRVIPLLDRVLIKRAEAITKTASGLVIPEKAQTKVIQGQVMAVGAGARASDGRQLAPLLAVGDRVLLPEYGGTKVKLDGDESEYHLFREADILAKLDS
ncbi:10 kDa heat shock protein, mitochondrial [Arctopsyche grandis]|uniref:10 kDa heat shock protein, mitochondrial n=1 Tax=Arctopsyche grandis TaxID=121162 RepID=UPI00406D6723